MNAIEVEVLLKEYNRSYQNTWEQTRFISFVVASSAGAKLKTPKDLMTFTWEQEAMVKPVVLTAAEFNSFKEAMIQSVNNFEAGNIEEIKL